MILRGKTRRDRQTSDDPLLGGREEHAPHFGLMPLLGCYRDVVIIAGAAAVDFAVVAGPQQNRISRFHRRVRILEPASRVMGLDQVPLEHLLNSPPGALRGAVVVGIAGLRVDVEYRCTQRTARREPKSDCHQGTCFP